MQKIDLTKKKPSVAIIALTIPVILTSLSQFTYNIVDTFFVGKLGIDAISAITVTTFYTGFALAAHTIVTTGCGIKVAHAIGEKNDLKLKKYLNNGYFLNLVLGIFFLIMLVLFGKYLINFIGIDNEKVQRDGYIYLVISAITLLFSFFNILFTRIMGSYGRNDLAFKISLVGVIVNIILDPILIYTFNLGVFGAGIATLIAVFITFIIFLFTNKKVFNFDFKIGISFKYIKKIVDLGLPFGIQRIAFTIFSIFVGKLVASFGSEATAAQRIGLQVESLTYMVTGGLNSAISGYVGQNFGAKKFKRILEGYKAAMLYGIIYTIITTILFISFGDFIIKIFVNDIKTISIGQEYLTVIAISQVFMAMEMITNGTFAGIGLPKVSTINSIVLTGLRIPLGYFLAEYYGVSGVFMAIAISSILKGIIIVILFYKLKWKEYKYAEEFI